MSTPWKHPQQDVVVDPLGVQRFRPNEIIRYLVDTRVINLNTLVIRGFPFEDWQQFAQLIGYSLGGYGELSYVTDEAYARAEQAAKEGGTKSAPL